MKGILLKTILIILTFFVGGIIFAFLKIFNGGELPVLIMWIIVAGMIAGIRAIWKYNPTSKEIDLKKDD